MRYAFATKEPRDASPNRCRGLCRGALLRPAVRTAGPIDDRQWSRSDDRPVDFVAARRVAGDFAGRPMGRLHCARGRLGRERLPHRNLARGRRERRDPAADEPGEDVQHVARMVARQPDARVRVGPGRETADLSHRRAWRRSPPAHLDAGRRRLVQMVSRRQVDRVHVNRSQDGVDEGARKDLRRVRRHRP